MSNSIQYLDLPGIFGAIQQIQGGQQRSRLLELQQQMENTKFQRGEKAYAAQQTLLDQITDPRQKLAATIAPDKFAASIFRDPKDNYSTSESGLWDFSSATPKFTPNPNAGIGTAPLPGTQQPSPSANLQGAAPPSPAPQRTIPTGPAKTIEGEVPAIYQPHIEDAAAVYGVDGGVLGRMLLKETKPNGSLTSPAGARGVMQFMGPTARQHGVDVDDPKSSIDGAGKMMSYLLKKYGGDYRLAVGAYNWGEGNVDQWIKDGADPAKVPKETMDYVRAVVGTATAGPTDQTGVDHPGTAKPQAGGAVPTIGQAPLGRAQASGGNYPPGMVGFRKNNKTGEFVSGGKPGYGIGVNAQGQELGSFPLPGMQAEVGGEFGNTPEARAIQVLVDSGKMTREQAAEWLAGKQVVGPNGQVDFRTPTGTQQVRPAQLSQGEKDAILESDKAVEAGNASIGALTKALELNDKAFSGATAEARAWADRNVLPGEWGGTATTELQNLISTQALNSLRAIFGGNPTEGERKILLDLQASVNKSPEERKIILDNALAGAKARVEREKARGGAMRSGTYFTQGLPQQAGGGGSGGAPDPNNPQVGDRARNSQTGAMIEWNGSAWVPVT